MTVTVRRATGADFAPLSALLERYYSEWDIWQRDPPDKVRVDLQQPTLGFFVAETHGILGGCVLCRPLPSVPSASECKRLFVASELRGHGIASRLMDAAEAATLDAGLDWIYLDSKAEFANAIALYRRRGYEDCPRYNRNAQATVFLRKHLRRLTVGNAQ